MGTFDLQPGRCCTIDAARTFANEIFQEYGPERASADELETALKVAGIFLFRGEELSRVSDWQTEIRKSKDSLQNRMERAEVKILRRRSGRYDKNWPVTGYLWKMAEAWEALGYRATPAWSDAMSDNEISSSAFSRFGDQWLQIIDPDREEMPSRQIYKDCLKKYRNALR